MLLRRIMASGDELKMESPPRAGLCLAVLSAMVGPLGVILCWDHSVPVKSKVASQCWGHSPSDVTATGREFKWAARSGDLVDPCLGNWSTSSSACG